MTIFAGEARRAATKARTRVLVLGGTGEARALAERIGADARLSGVVSLAGRVGAPMTQALETRIGGFGGADGLARYLAEQRIEKVVDATHPFAAQISANARIACKRAGVPLIGFSRAPWMRLDRDRWTGVADGAQAANALGEAPRRVFLTIGRQGAAAFKTAPQHDYLLRVIDPPDAGDLPPNCEVISARGPFGKDAEAALMREKRIDIVVSKNSGGAQTYAKIEAARELGLEVVMIQPPAREGRVVYDIEEAMAFLTGAEAASV